MSTLRSIRDIQTAARLQRAGTPPHQLYMRLCTLEMERHRLELERNEAMERVERTTRRCEQIDREAEELRARIRPRVSGSASSMVTGGASSWPGRSSGDALEPGIVLEY